MHEYGIHISGMLGEERCVNESVHMQSKSYHQPFDTGEINSFLCSQTSLSNQEASCVVRHVKAAKGKTSKRKLSTVGFPCDSVFLSQPQLPDFSLVSECGLEKMHSSPSILFDLCSLPDVSVQIRACDRCSLA